MASPGRRTSSWAVLLAFWVEGGLLYMPVLIGPNTNDEHGVIWVGVGGHRIVDRFRICSVTQETT